MAVGYVSLMDWQSRYQSGDTPWDKGTPAPSLEHLICDIPTLFSEGKRILVPGCGLGHDALLLASHVGAAGKVLGADIAALAIEQARQRATGLENVEFLELDLFNLPDPMCGYFDGVWEHTCFCAIDPSLRARYVSAMWEALKPGSFLAGVFFINPDVEAGEGPPFGASVREICAAFAGRFTLERELEPKAFYLGREEREQILVFRRED